MKVAVAVDGLRVMVRDVRKQNGRFWVTGVDAYVCESCRLVWDWSHMVAVADTDLEFKHVVCPCALGFLDVATAPVVGLGYADRARCGVGAGNHVLKQEEPGEVWVYWEGYVIAVIPVFRWLNEAELCELADRWPAAHAAWN